MVQLPIRPHVKDLPLLETGGAAAAESMRLGARRLVRLNTNEAPFQPFPQALEALQESLKELNRYPHPTAEPLAAQLAEHYGVGADQVIVDAGSSQLIFLLAEALLAPGDELVYPWPSFPIYGGAALRAQGKPVRVPLRDHCVDTTALQRAITPRTRIVVICSPNNPTGTVVARADLDRFIAELPPGVVAVLDEAYAEFADDFADGLGYVRQGRPVLVLRTFSKVYGLAGARVGYGIGPAELIDALKRVQVPYPVNQLALAAAIASLPLQDQVAERVRANRDGREQLYEGFRRLGLDSIPSQANFVFVEVGRDGTALAQQLMRRGILVRPGRGYDCPSYLRVTVGLPEENALFLEALEQVLGETTRV